MARPRRNKAIFSSPGQEPFRINATSARLDGRMEARTADELPLFSNMLNHADGSNFLLSSGEPLDADHLMEVDDGRPTPELPEVTAEPVWRSSNGTLTAVATAESSRFGRDEMQSCLEYTRQHDLLLAEVEKDDDQWLYMPAGLETERGEEALHVASAEISQLHERRASTLHASSQRDRVRWHNNSENRRNSQRAMSPDSSLSDGPSGGRLTLHTAFTSEPLELESRNGNAEGGAGSFSDRVRTSSLRQRLSASASFKSPSQEVGNVPLGSRNAFTPELRLQPPSLRRAGRAGHSQKPVTASERILTSSIVIPPSSMDRNSAMPSSPALKRSGSLESVLPPALHVATLSRRYSSEEVLIHKGGQSLLSSRNSSSVAYPIAGSSVTVNLPLPLLSDETPSNLRTTRPETMVSVQDARRRSIGGSKSGSMTSRPLPSRRVRKGRSTPIRGWGQSEGHTSTSGSMIMPTARHRGSGDASSGFNSSSFRALRFHEVTSVLNLKSPGVATSSAPAALQQAEGLHSPHGIRSGGRNALASIDMLANGKNPRGAATGSPGSTIFVSAHEEEEVSSVAAPCLGSIARVRTSTEEGVNNIGESEAVGPVEGRRTAPLMNHLEDKLNQGSTQSGPKMKRIRSLHRVTDSQARGSSEKWLGMEEGSTRSRSSSTPRRSSGMRLLASPVTTGLGHEEEVSRYYGSFSSSCKGGDGPGSSDEGSLPGADESDAGDMKEAEERRLIEEEDEEEGALADVEADSDTHPERGEIWTADMGRGNDDVERDDGSAAAREPVGPLLAIQTAENEESITSNATVELFEPVRPRRKPTGQDTAMELSTDSGMEEENSLSKPSHEAMREGDSEAAEGRDAMTGGLLGSSKVFAGREVLLEAGKAESPTNDMMKSSQYGNKGVEGEQEDSEKEKVEAAEPGTQSTERETDSSCLDETRLKRPYVERGFLTREGSGEEPGDSSACSPSMEEGKLFGVLVEDVKAQIEGWKMEDAANQQLVDSSASEVDADRLIASHELRQSGSDQVGRSRDDKGLLRGDIKQLESEQPSLSTGREVDGVFWEAQEVHSIAGGAAVVNRVEPRTESEGAGCRSVEHDHSWDENGQRTESSQKEVNGGASLGQQTTTEDVNIEREDFRTEVQDSTIGSDSILDRTAGEATVANSVSGSPTEAVTAGGWENGEAGATQLVPKRGPSIAKPSIRTYKAVPVGVRLVSSGFSSYAEQLRKLAMGGTLSAGTASSRPGSSAKSNSSDPYEWERSSSIVDSDISTPSTLPSRNMGSEDVMDLDDFMNGQMETMDEDGRKVWTPMQKIAEKKRPLRIPLEPGAQSPYLADPNLDTTAASLTKVGMREGDNLEQSAKGNGDDMTGKSREQEAQPACGCTIL